jgi:hypothetical protein
MNDVKMRRLQQVLEPELLQILPNSILPQDDGYLAFGRYLIKKDSNRWTVCQDRRDPREFGSARTALSWCIAEKNQQYHVSSQIQKLDQERSMLASDIDTRSHLQLKIRDAHLREAVDAKISNRKHRLHWVQTTLDKWVNVAKYWQIRGFNNETSRTGRSPSHRTNR